MTIQKKLPWFVSLHGGHSASYCDHASDLLPDMIQAAIQRGMFVFGISEHAPRYEPHYLYPEEIAMGWTIHKIQEDFERYSSDSLNFVQQYSTEIILLRAFEIEVAPRKDYIQRMQQLRQTHQFDYMVGSVHYVEDMLFDHRDTFGEVVTKVGGLEKLILLYYELLTEMVLQLKPEVVAHLDVYRKYSDGNSELETPAVKKAAEQAIEAIQTTGAILDINTGAYRKGLRTPFPSPWLVRIAHTRGIPVCFGDDSHSCSDVGAGIPQARDYLLDLGVKSIGVLQKKSQEIIMEEVALI